MGWGWSPYVTVAERRANAQHRMDKLRKQGVQVQSVEIEGNKIAKTFWGQSWCQQLESFSDYENRLPRGRSYVRNGSVCHLEIAAGEVKAVVSGTDLYDVRITIKRLPDQKWCKVKERCSGKIGSLLELLQGRFSDSVMTVVTDRREGLFPLSSEIKLNCSCPDWADMCKHVAAVLYGVGARLDKNPELLFLLRGVDHEELIAADAAIALASGGNRGGRRIAESSLEDIFGIEMCSDNTSTPVEISPKSGKASAGKGKSGNRVRAGKSTDKFETADEVRELRTRLDLSPSELALLVGVTPSSVRAWESKPGLLKLQPRNLQALKTTATLTKKQVRSRLSED